MSIHMEEVMKQTMILIALVLTLLIGWPSGATAFEQGEIVLVETFCRSEQDTKAFLSKGGNCIMADKKFPCVMVKNHDIHNGWQIIECRPSKKFTIFSYHRAAKGISL